MLEYVVGGIILLVLYIAYAHYYAPKQELKRYSNLIKGLGYSVLQFPFVFCGNGDFQSTRRGFEEHNDPFWVQKNQYHQYDVVLSNRMNKISLAFINPDLIRDFLGSDKINIYQKADIFTKNRAMLGLGSFFVEKAQWKQHRKMLSKIFNFELVKTAIPKMCQICDIKINSMEQSSKVKDGEYSCYLLDLGGQIFLGILMLFFFGRYDITEKINDQNFDTHVKNLIKDVKDLPLNPLVLLFQSSAFRFGGITADVRKIMKRIRDFQTIAQGMINKRVEDLPKDLKPEPGLEQILFQQTSAKQSGLLDKEYSNQSIVEDFCLFTMGGSDTSAHLLMMTVYLTVEDPQIQRKVRDSINAVIKTDQDYTYENLKKLTYLDWVQYETTRYYGPLNAIFPRQVLQDHFIGKIPITKGTELTQQNWGNHYNEKYFKNPHEFRPERWESECNQLKPFVLTGFSGGPRGCLGRQLALLETKIAMVKLFKRYQKIVIPQVPKQKKTMTFGPKYMPPPFNTTFIHKANQDIDA